MTRSLAVLSFLVLAACPDPGQGPTDTDTDTDTHTDTGIEVPPAELLSVTGEQDGLSIRLELELADGWSGLLPVTVGQGAASEIVTVTATDGLAEVVTRVDDPCTAIPAQLAALSVRVPEGTPVELDVPLVGSTVDGSFVDAVDGLVVACGQSPNVVLQINVDGLYRLTGGGHFTRDGGAASMSGATSWNLHLGQYAVTLDAAPYVFAVEAL